MDKVFFISITNHIKECVPSIKWIDADEAQFETRERPPVAFPACLVDISYPHCETLPGGKQKVKATVELRIAFTLQGQTNANAPLAVRQRALTRFDILNEVHQALQWWDGGHLFNPLRRTRSIPERRADGLKVYRVTYETEFFE